MIFSGTVMAGSLAVNELLRRGDHRQHKKRPMQSIGLF